MEHAQSRELRAAGVWAITVAGHLLLMMAFVFANRSTTPARPESEAEPVFVLINLSSAPSATGEATAGAERTAVVRPPHTASDRRAKRSPATATTAVTVAAVVTPGTAPIDWNRESALAGQRLGAAEVTTKSRTFGAPLAPSTQLCRQSNVKAPWNKELRRAGFIGGLPYVRLGKRCLVGLPFFGCAIGHLPEADSQLLADMGNTDRARSSVPNFPDCVPAAAAAR